MTATQQRDFAFAVRVSELHLGNSQAFSGMANYWGKQELNNYSHNKACKFVEATAKATKALFSINKDIHNLQNQ